MSVITKPTYDFFPIPKQSLHKQAPNISYWKASTPGVSRGSCGNTQPRGSGRATSARRQWSKFCHSPGHRRGCDHMLGSGCHLPALQGVGGSRSWTGSNESLPAPQLPAGWRWGCSVWMSIGKWSLFRMISWFLPVNLLALLMLLVCQSVQYRLSSNTVIANGCGSPVIDSQYRDIIRSNTIQASKETRKCSFHCPLGFTTANLLKYALH